MAGRGRHAAGLLQLGCGPAAISCQRHRRGAQVAGQAVAASRCGASTSASQASAAVARVLQARRAGRLAQLLAHATILLNDAQEEPAALAIAQLERRLQVATVLLAKSVPEFLALGLCLSIQLVIGGVILGKARLQELGLERDARVPHDLPHQVWVELPQQVAHVRWHTIKHLATHTRITDGLGAGAAFAVWAALTAAAVPQVIGQRSCHG
mmetsp:Transcript_5613/g.13093  ORF Transcript_5613/g.13093 Transcript_5613/m.13093 type:complete len:211 (+) Transcript_5613:524-1156(+)